VDISSAPPAECFEVSWLFVDVRFDEVLLVRDDFNEVGPWFVFRIHEQVVPLDVPRLQVVGVCGCFSYFGETGLLSRQVVGSAMHLRSKSKPAFSSVGDLPLISSRTY
jgi:hypothetical protein